MQLDADCLMQIFARLPINDKVTCRRVAKSWLTAIDTVLTGQKSLSIVIKSQDDRLIGSSFNEDSVKLTRGSINFSAFQFMTKLKNVTELTIDGLQCLADVVVFSLANMPNADDNDDDEVPMCLFDNLRGYGWQMLTESFPRLAKLTLRHCKLTNNEITKLISVCPKLSTLDISDNPIDSQTLTKLKPGIVNLSCGDLTTGHPLGSLIESIADSQAASSLKKLSLFGKLSSLAKLVNLTQLEQLEVHFFVDDDDHIDESKDHFSAIGKLTNLKKLKLDQIRCHDHPSAINTTKLQSMVAKLSQLKELSIIGDYGWHLRLSDHFLRSLPKTCPRLSSLTIVGSATNSQITDRGVASLSQLTLSHLSLSCFDSITDKSITEILVNGSKQMTVKLVETASINGQLVSEAVKLCRRESDKKVKLELSMTGIDEIRFKKLPKNLSISIEPKIAKRRRDEPSTAQLMVVMVMSLIILVMALLTTVAIVIVPMAMLLMMANEAVTGYLIVVLNEQFKPFKCGYNCNYNYYWSMFKHLYLRFKQLVQ